MRMKHNLTLMCFMFKARLQKTWIVVTAERAESEDLLISAILQEGYCVSCLHLMPVTSKNNLVHTYCATYFYKPS
jgi:hypothetical protein